MQLEKTRSLPTKLVSIGKLWLHVIKALGSYGNKALLPLQNRHLEKVMCSHQVRLFVKLSRSWTITFQRKLDGKNEMCRLLLRLSSAVSLFFCILITICLIIFFYPTDYNFLSTAVQQAVACAPVTQRVRVRSPDGTSFLGEVFSGFSTPVRQMSGNFRPTRFSYIIGRHNHFVFVYLSFRARQHLRSLAPGMKWWAMIMMAKWYRGPWGLNLPDIHLIGEEKPRKNLTQETCSDRGSNLGPLHDKRACYHLLHSSGPSQRRTLTVIFLCCQMKWGTWQFC